MELHCYCIAGNGPRTEKGYRRYCAKYNVVAESIVDAINLILIDRPDFIPYEVIHKGEVHAIR